MKVSKKYWTLYTSYNIAPQSVISLKTGNIFARFTNTSHFIDLKTLYFSENVLRMYTGTPTKYPRMRDARNLTQL